MIFIIWKNIKTIPQKTLLLLINLYRYFISPLLGQHCRFQPSCSSYAKQAITQLGFMRGMLLMLRRLSRCHPWGGSGYDPVPELKKEC